MLILPLKEQFTWQHKHMSNFEPSYHSSTRRALGDQWFSKHLQLDQNALEHRKKGKESRKVGRVWLTSLDLKPLELLVCNKKLKSESWKITGMILKIKPVINCTLYSLIGILRLYYSRLYLLKSLFKNYIWQIKHVLSAHHAPILIVGI